MLGRSLAANFEPVVCVQYDGPGTSSQPVVLLCAWSVFGSVILNYNMKGDVKLCDMVSRKW